MRPFFIGGNVTHLNGKLLISDFGEWPAPEDLLALYEAAPKASIGNPPHDRLIPDLTDHRARPYYIRERELLKAIEVIEMSGTMQVKAVAGKSDEAVRAASLLVASRRRAEQELS